MHLEVVQCLSHEQKSSRRHCQRNRRSQGRKTCFACRKAERGQAQPQLYGTSYFFVKIAPIGQTLVWKCLRSSASSRKYDAHHSWEAVPALCPNRDLDANQASG